MTPTSTASRLFDRVRDVAAQDPARELIVLGADRLAYRQVADAALALADTLREAGLQPGARVAYLGCPGPGFLITQFAAHEAGAAWMGLNPRYTAIELARLIEDAEPSIIFVEQDARDNVVADVLSAAGAATPCPVVHASAHWSDLRHVGGNIPAPSLALEPGIALLVYTSGTTGVPKGACLSQRAVMSAASLYAERYAHPELRSLLNLPINHVGALIDLTAAAIAMGGTLVAMRDFQPEAIPDMLREERITILGQVPTMHLMIEAQGGSYCPERYPDLRHIVWSGAAMPRSFIERHHGRGIELSTCYGQTECTGSVTFTAPDATIEALASSVGQPAAAGLVRIVAAYGTPVPHGEPGEVQISGDCLMNGYFRRPEQTAEAFTDGWLRSGDLGVIDETGAVRLVGRRKEMFKSGGYNVYPREIETVLEEQPAVSAAAVIAMPDPVWQEIGWAFLIASPGAREDDIAAFARARLANFKVPKRFILRPELPLLPVGKIDKRALQEAALAGAHA
ncbi:MAG: acyl--CoA ligase [Blastomonas sp.]|nr:acyl--CoA ligase [Blastomonas sp.]